MKSGLRGRGWVLLFAVVLLGAPWATAEAGTRTRQVRQSGGIERMAQSSVSCSFDSVSGTMTVTAALEAYLVVPSDQGGVLFVDDAPCAGSPTTAEVDRITIVGSNSDDVVIVDYSGLPFAPGRMAEASGLSEIEFTVSLGGGFDAFVVGSTFGPDSIHLGADGLNINADDDADIALGVVEQIEVFALAGDDSVSGQGGFGTGGPFQSTQTTSASVLILEGGNGNDFLQGAAAFTGVGYISSSRGVSIDIPAGEARGQGFDTFEHITDAFGSDFGDSIVGDAGENFVFSYLGHDTIISGAGADAVFGMGGNDLFRPGEGIDEVVGGPGTDTLSFAGAAGGVTANLSSGTSSGQGADSLMGVENLVGSAYRDRLTGNRLRNRILAGRGSDSVSGLGGPDRLEGGPGADALLGGSGSDGLYGGSEGDRIEGGPDGDKLFGASGRNKLFGGTGRDLLVGGASVDRLEGGGEADRVYGKAGNDVLLGGAGNDLLDGGTGNDLIRGGGGSDTLRGALGTDTCYQNSGGGPESSCELPAPPPPPPPEPDCTPGYSPCIPPGPDVDCAGGSGDGPRYVEGPVKVTGDDPYGLDSDGDGVGCET